MKSKTQFASLTRKERALMRRSQREAEKIAEALVRIDGTRSVTTTLVVAEKFGKRHDRVVRAVNQITSAVESRSPNLGSEIVETDASDSSKLRTPRGATMRRQMEDAIFQAMTPEQMAEWVKANIVLSEYFDERGKRQPMYLLTEKGFAVVVMGFTGAPALAWKMRFADAFEKQKALIQRMLNRKSDPEWTMHRAMGIVMRHELMDAVKEFVTYAKEAGSKNAENYYRTITRMIYRALFDFEDELDAPPRERLTVSQLNWLQDAEMVAAKAIRFGIQKAMEYHAIYRHAKDQVLLLVRVLDCRSRVLSDDGAALALPCPA